MRHGRGDSHPAGDEITQAPNPLTAWVTAATALVAFVAGCVTFAQGFRAGSDRAALTAHLYWGFATLVLQLFAAGIAIVHARAGRSRAEARPAARSPG